MRLSSRRSKVTAGAKGAAPPPPRNDSLGSVSPDSMRRLLGMWLCFFYSSGFSKPSCHDCPEQVPGQGLLAWHRDAFSPRLAGERPLRSRCPDLPARRQSALVETARQPFTDTSTDAQYGPI